MNKKTILAIGILETILIVLMAIGIGYLVVVGIDRQEAHECQTLAMQEDLYTNFWSTDWQKEMCEAHGIELTK